jgi:hypothetical protein
LQTNVQSNSMLVTDAKAISHPWLMLISRSVLFLIFQVLIALILFATDRHRLRLERIGPLVDIHSILHQLHYMRIVRDVCADLFDEFDQAFRMGNRPILSPTCMVI